jgi:hypothetical protein
MEFKQLELLVIEGSRNISHFALPPRCGVMVGSRIVYHVVSRSDDSDQCGFRVIVLTTFLDPEQKESPSRDKCPVNFLECIDVRETIASLSQYHDT